MPSERPTLAPTSKAPMSPGPGAFQHLLDQRKSLADMVARGQLRHHTAVARMNLDLAVKAVGQQPALTVVDSHAGLVTGRFYTQYPHQLANPFPKMAAIICQQRRK